MSRRERMRDATLQEIKDVAREHLRAHGPSGISLRGIARVMGMTAPGLYRYYSGLDDLLAAMIETYTNEACDAMEAARDELPEDDLGGRLIAVTRLEVRMTSFRAVLAASGSRYCSTSSAPVG